MIILRSQSHAFVPADILRDVVGKQKARYPLFKRVRTPLERLWEAGALGGAVWLHRGLPEAHRGGTALRSCLGQQFYMTSQELFV